MQALACTMVVGSHVAQPISLKALPPWGDVIQAIGTVSVGRGSSTDDGTAHRIVATASGNHGKL